MIEKKVKMAITILASYIIGFIYVDSFILRSEHYEVWRIIFALGLVIWVESLAYEREKKVKIREALFWLISMILLVCAPLIRGNGTMFGETTGGVVGFFFVLALHMVAVLYILSRYDYLVEGKIGSFFAIDWIYGFIIIPFSRFFLRIKLLVTLLTPTQKEKKEEEHKDRGVIIFLFICGTIVLLFIAIDLLSSADERFAQLMRGIINFSWLNMKFVFSFVLSIPVGAYLFGLVVGCCTKCVEKVDHKNIIQSIGKMRVLPNVMLSAALAMFCLIYGLYISLQVGYFVGALTGNLPEEFTFSEYARQGFFELCMIMALNLSLLFLVAKLSKNPMRESVGLKSVVTLFLVESLFFAVTAFSKLVLYIDAYGFTSLRLLSSWCVFALTLAVICATISVWKPFKVVGKVIYVSVATYVIVCFL